MSYNFKKNLCVIAIALVIGLGLVATPRISKGEVASSSGSYTVLAPLPCIEGGDVKCTGGNGALQEKVDFKTYVQYTFNLLIGLSAAVAVIQIVWGGIEYIVTTSITGKKTGLDRAKNAIYGLLLVLTSFIILRTVDPRFTEIPNTLVPKIEFNSLLTQDANKVLRDRLLSDIEKGKVRNAENDLKIKEANKSLDQISNNISSIEQRINEIKSSPEGLEKPGAESELRELEIQKQKLNQELQQQKTDRTLLEAKRDFDLLISSVYDETVSNTDLSPQDQVKKINEYSSKIDLIAKTYNSSMVTNGEVSVKKLAQETQYSKQILNLYKTKISNLSAREVYDGPTYQGKIKIQMVNANGELVLVATKKEVKQILQTQINIADQFTKTLDQSSEMKTLLESEISDTQKRIDVNKTIN